MTCQVLLLLGFVCPCLTLRVRSFRACDGAGTVASQAGPSAPMSDERIKAGCRTTRSLLVSQRAPGREPYAWRGHSASRPGEREHDATSDDGATCDTELIPHSASASSTRAIY